MSKLDELIKEYCRGGVEHKPLKDVCEIRTGKGLTKKDCVNNGIYPIISGGIEPLGYCNIFNRNANTVTISRAGTAGYVNFIEEDFWVNDKCFSVIPLYNNLLPKYLYYSLKNIEEQIFELRSTGSVPTVNTEKLSKIKIPLPPLPVQEEIVRILDLYNTKKEELISNLTKEQDFRNKQYISYRDKLLAFDASVNQANLLDVVNVLYGFPCDASKFNIDKNGMPLIRIRDVPNGFTTTYTTESVPPAYIIHKGDLLIGMDGNFHVNSWNSEDAILCQRVCKITSFDENILLNRYLHHLMPPMIKKIEDNKLSGTVKHLLAKDIANISVPLPSINIQKRIVDTLDNFDKICTDLNIGLPAEIEARQKEYEFYRNELLSFDYLNAERRTQNAERRTQNAERA